MFTLKSAGYGVQKILYKGGVHRVRGENPLRLVTSKPREEYTKKIDLEWWTKFIKGETDEREINAIMGEHYSTLIKLTHKLNAYQDVDEYGVVCFLASLTKNNGQTFQFS